MDNEHLWAKYRSARNKVVSVLRNAKSDYFKKLCDKLNNNKFSSKNWWCLVKKVSCINNQKSKENISVLLNDDNEVITGDLDKAKLLNSFFSSQSIIDDSDKHIPDLDQNSEYVLEQITITELDVKGILATLDTSKASGPDLISPKMLKEASNALAYPLSKLFNLSLSTKIYPKAWKCANVTPVFKKNDPKKLIIIDLYLF